MRRRSNFQTRLVESICELVQQRDRVEPIRKRREVPREQAQFSGEVQVQRHCLKNLRPLHFHGDGLARRAECRLIHLSKRRGRDRFVGDLAEDFIDWSAELTFYCCERDFRIVTRNLEEISLLQIILPFSHTHDFGSPCRTAFEVPPCYHEKKSAVVRHVGYHATVQTLTSSGSRCQA